MPRPRATAGITQPPPLASVTWDQMRRLLHRQWSKAMLAAQLIAAAILLCRGLAWLQPAELAVYDRLVVAWAGRNPSDRILLVTATEADLGRYGWPLRDQHLAN